ncbi:MAG TPA: hydroxyacylglutathione hydrolase [Myxococcota bacterium]
MNITLEQIPVLDDNYIYAVDVDGRCFVVDPAEAAPVLAWLGDRRLAAIINTHHHSDHVGGNVEIAAATGCRVIGPAHDRDRIPAITEGAVVGGTVDVCGLTLRVLDVHGHTRGHIAYAFDGAVDVVVRHGHHGARQRRAELEGRPVLFVGDALFAAGCGRLFEGDGADLFAAMTTLAAQDPRALVACAHEYTSSNLRFAAHALPDNAAVAARLANLEAERGPSGSSVPSTLAQELATNPWLLALRHDDAEERGFELRRRKDTFRA